MKSKPLFPALLQKSLAQHIFIGLTLILLGSNLFYSHKQLKEKHAAREKIPYIFLGYKYLGINALIGSNGRVAYLTDKNMDDRVNAMEFAQAEVLLVPLTLDLNNPQHEYVILACSSDEENFKKARELGLTPLRRNPFGIILAKNPKASQP